MRITQSAFLWAAGLCGGVTLSAYDLTGSAWANGDIVMQLQLGNPSQALSDGSTTWGSPAQRALTEWNNYIARSKFTYIDPSSAPKSNNTNSYNNVFFAATVAGEDFDDGVLAITRRWVVATSSGAYRISEADVVFNTDYTWDSYRGTRRQRPDFQRVAIHEFGHVLGLDHPDEAEPPQSVSAIMNSRVSDIDTLQGDDIAGAQFLYSPQTQPVITQQPSSVVVMAGEPFSMTYAASGPPISQGWLYSRANSTPSDDLLNGDGNPWEGATYSVAAADPADAGYYRGFAANVVGSATTNTAQVVVQAPAGMELAYAANISTRGFVGTGDNILIAGFIINGSTSKSVLIRGIGPALANYGVSGVLADPKITLLNEAGTVVAENDNWGGDAALAAAFVKTDAFILPPGSKDAALLATLAPGKYTVHLTGVANSTGIALAEVYDADDTPEQSLTRKLVNISTRGYVGVNAQILIAGFIIDGPAPKRVLLRAAGPALTSFGVAGVNTDPNIRLFRDGTQIADNDDWYFSNQVDLLPSLFSQVSAFPFDERSYDSAMVITLQPGSYTVHVEGRSGETGIALVEVYEVP